jgi:hypothetical protein
VKAFKEFLWAEAGSTALHIFSVFNREPRAIAPIPREVFLKNSLLSHCFSML